MDEREVLVRMLKQLVEDMQSVSQAGAGYYSCIPVANRYNKLLQAAKRVVPGADSVITTFDEIEAQDPKDPADKWKVMNAIRIEIGQLISLLHASKEAHPPGQEQQAQ